jgi:catechol 2,3-dioxygenase-like lactoylglutathione lyase family enzyme
MKMPRITAILESSLYVDDLERSIRFYKGLFQFEPLMADSRFCAFSVSGRQVLLLFSKRASAQAVETRGGTIPGHDGTGRLHLAFSIPASELEDWKRRLEEKNIALESSVQWPRGGQSVYFRDPDGHLLEFVTPGTWSIY